MKIDAILAIVSDALPSASVDCLLIGGFAVNYYGYTRNTLDVDLMMAGDKLDIVRRIMMDAGFTNIIVQENVAFFSAADSGPRVDFLQVDADTMSKLLAGAVNAIIHGYPLKVPALKDLIAMKIFALSQDTERRFGKDLPDIAYLAVLNNLDLAADIQPLCDRFGNDKTFNLIRNHVEALRKS